MLHIVNKSPLQTKTLDSCLRVAGHNKEDAILLVEDAVYAATQGNVVANEVAQRAQAMRVYALRPDLEARGMHEKVIEGINLVDYGGFVDLVAEHSSVQSWL